MAKMTVYHGGYISVENPQVRIGRNTKDFGTGFYCTVKDIVVFREEGRLTSLSASDFEDYRAKVNEYVEAHKTTPAINKLLHNEPISVEDYNELERIFTVELGTAEDYEMNYQDTPFGLLIRKIAKMDRTAAYAAFSTFILEERPNTEQLHFIEQVVDYVVENGYINNVLDLMKTPFDRPYKFSLIFTYRFFNISKKQRVIFEGLLKIKESIISKRAHNSHKKRNTVKIRTRLIKTVIL